MKYPLTFVVEQGGMEDASPEEVRQAMEAWTAFDDEASEGGRADRMRAARAGGDDHPPAP